MTLSLPIKRMTQPLLLLLVASLASLTLVQSFPSFTMDQRQPRKCMTVDYGMAETLHVAYTIAAVDSPAKNNPLHQHRNSATATGTSKNSLFLEIRPSPDTPTSNNQQKQKQQQQQHQAKDPNLRLVKPMLDDSGVILYDQDYTGSLELCVMLKGGPMATVPAAMVSLKIMDDIDPDKFDSMEGAYSEQQKQQQKQQQQEQLQQQEQQERELETHAKAAHHHMSHMEHSLHRLLKDSDMFVSHADYMKETEAVFHQRSVDMNQISKYWPILHLIVLLVTGFTQANHIVKFFKSRHII